MKSSCMGLQVFSSRIPIGMTAEWQMMCSNMERGFTLWVVNELGPWLNNRKTTWQKSKAASGCVVGPTVVPRLHSQPDSSSIVKSAGGRSNSLRCRETVYNLIPTPTQSVSSNNVLILKCMTELERVSVKNTKEGSAKSELAYKNIQLLGLLLWCSSLRWLRPPPIQPAV